MNSTTASPSRRAKLRFALQCGEQVDDTGLPSAAEVRRCVRAALVVPLLEAEVTVRLVGTDEGRRLNAQFRRRDRPTNVLSFPYTPAPRLRGDLVLCVPVVAAEADAVGAPRRAHFAHLVVHGMLHLQGYDHEEEGAALAMERLERDVLAGLGYPDPYADDVSAPCDTA